MTSGASRRKFLKETLFGVAALSVAKFFPLGNAYAAVAEAGEPLKFFSPMEFLIMKNVAARIVGDPTGGHPGTDVVNVAFRADAFLSNADPEVQDQFHQLLTVFNGALFAFLFDFRFSSFVDMSPAAQDSYLQSWMTSALSFRRTAFQALKRVSLSLFYTDSRTWNEVHYDGMFLPWERDGGK
jgi:hypothetical protein